MSAETLKFVIGGEVGLFPPLTVGICGKDYVCSINYPWLKKILELESGAVSGSLEALAAMYEEAEMMTGCPREILDALDVREVRELIMHVANQIFHAEKVTPAKEKNGSAPGESK